MNSHNYSFQTMKHFLLCVFLLLAAFGAGAQTRRGNVYALVVGVSEYENPADNLPYSASTALEVYNLLKRNTSSDKIVLLTNKNATYQNILNVAEWLFTQTNSDDSVIFYFNGHGYEGGLAAHDFWIDYSELKQIFRRTKAQRKIIFADACFSGIMRSRNTQRNSNSNNFENQRVCLFLSSRSDQYSWQTSELETGYFSYYLLAGLRGGADTDRNKVITARELFNFVYPRVREHSGGIQTPVMWGRFENSMEILNWNR